MFSFIKSIIELLYDYKLSVFYKIHALLTLAVIICFFWQIWAKHIAKEEQANPKQDKFSTKIKYVDFQAQKRAATSAELNKLTSSKEYQKFLRDKVDPNSRYNRVVDLQDIDLSDDEDIKETNEIKEKKFSTGPPLGKYKLFK